MKFCLVTTFFPPMHFGGDAVFTANLANLLVAEGHQVQVIHCADSFELLRKTVQLSEFPLDSRVQVHTLRSRWGALSPTLTHLTGRPVLQQDTLRRLLDQDFDVTHWHNISLVGGSGAVELGRGVQLCTLHDYWWICPTSILFKNNREVCKTPTCFRCTLAQSRPPQFWRTGSLLGRAALAIDRFIAPSEFVRQKFSDSELSINATVIPHFISPVPAVDKQREDYYLFVGRLERAKGLHTIIPLFGETRRRLLVIGSGNEETSLRKQAGPYPTIEFLGRRPYAELPDFYARARATIIPSICYETFGLTVLESLQQQTPALVSDFGAPQEIIEETVGGAVYHDVAELREILDKWDVSPDLPREAGASGFSRLTRYLPSAHLDRYFSLIDEVQQQKGSSRP